MPPKPTLNVTNFPRPPLLQKTPRHLQIRWDDLIIADTTDAYWVLETHHPPSPWPPLPLPLLFSINTPSPPTLSPPPRLPTSPTPHPH